MSCFATCTVVFFHLQLERGSEYRRWWRLTFIICKSIQLLPHVQVSPNAKSKWAADTQLFVFVWCMYDFAFFVELRYVWVFGSYLWFGIKQHASLQKHAFPGTMLLNLHLSVCLHASGLRFTEVLLKLCVMHCVRPRRLVLYPWCWMLVAGITRSENCIARLGLGEYQKIILIISYCFSLAWISSCRFCGYRHHRVFHSFSKGLQ